MVNITCPCFTRFISVIVLIILILSNLYFLYKDIFLYGTDMAALHFVFYLFGMVAIPIIASVPLLYDIFRSQKVKYYVFVGSAFIAFLGLSALFLSVAELGMSEVGRYDIFRFVESLIIVLLAVLLVLVSTVWRKYIRLFYGIITPLFLVYYILFALVFYLLDFFNPAFLDVAPFDLIYVLDVLFVIALYAWCVFRSCSKSTFELEEKKAGIQKTQKGFCLCTFCSCMKKKKRAQD